MERLWTKSFVLLTLSMLFLFTGFYFLLPTFPIFVRQLGANETQIGIAAGLFTLAAVVFRPIVGELIDRYGRRAFVIWGLVFFIVSIYAYEWVGGLLVLFVLRIVHGMSWAFSTTSISAATTDIIPASRRGEGMGWFGMAMTSAMAIGPLLGVWIMEHFSFHTLFLTAAILSAIALTLAASNRMPYRVSNQKRRIVFFEKPLLPIMALIFFLTVSYGGITTFLPLFAESLSVNAGLFFLIYAIMLTLIRPVAGIISDKYGETVVILPALAVTASAMIVLAFSAGPVGIFAAAVLYGIGFGSAQPSLQAAALHLADPQRKGAANASFLTAFDLGIGLGSILLGAVSQLMGYSQLFLLSAFSIAITLIIFTPIVGRMLKNQREKSGNESSANR